MIKTLTNKYYCNHEKTYWPYRSCVLHPASTTHSQLSAQQLIDAGISEGTVRLSIGIEDKADIIADIKQALDRV